MNRKNLSAWIITGIFSVICGVGAYSQEVKYNTPGAGNPVIPGYFADPTVVKFGDTYYLYATTDGNGGGLGPSQVWVSKDFVNWTIMPMNWPNTHWIWAPDVMEKDGKYYMYYCQPCNIYCGVSETPRGPWTNILGEEEAILVPDRLEPMAITLDGQTFVDEDGSIYLYWGTWGIYPKHGCGVGKFNSDLKSFEKVGLIPNTQAKDFFEAPFVLKKDGIYYFTYSSGSCHDGTYRVQYAVSKEGPMGPFEFPDNNPILETNADGSVHGPGHHSIIQVDGEYYIVYHRHNNPNATRGMHRQIAIDRLKFSADGRIEKVIPTHQGVGYLGEDMNPFLNLAYGKPVKASSVYSEEFKPEYAVDDNNATIWRAAKAYGEEWIEIDLGKIETIRRIRTEFEYATSYYQYKTEVSVDGKIWEIFADKSRNTLAGSPMTDFGETKARYVRLTILGKEMQGLIGAVWNIKVYGDYREDPPQKLVDLQVTDETTTFKQWENTNGMMGGMLSVQNGEPMVKQIGGKKAVVLPGGASLVSSFVLPDGFKNDGAWTIAYSAYGLPDDVLHLYSWQPQGKKMMKIGKNKGEKNWYQVAFVSDGKEIKGYLNQQEISRVKMVNVEKPDHFWLYAREGEIAVTGIKLYNWKLEPAEIRDVFSHEQMLSVEPALKPQGLLAHICADDYPMGTTLNELENKGGLPGGFKVSGGELSVALKQNRMAFTFDGKTKAESSFRLPATISGLGNYTIAAWVLNPEVDENECIVDLNSGEGELNKVVLGYGKSRSSGIMCHYGNFEDIALQEIPVAGQWHHLVATYDGYAERVYVDGKLQVCKDMVLRLTPEGKVVLGKRNDGQWGFSGYLNELNIYDYPLNSKEVEQMATGKSNNRILFNLDCGEYDNGDFVGWKNEGQWGGESAPGAVVTEIEGKSGLRVLGNTGCRIEGVMGKQSETTLLMGYLVPLQKAHLLSLVGENTFSILAENQKIIVRNGEVEHPFVVEEINTGEWGLLALVNTGKQLKVYVNGKYITTFEDMTLPQHVEQLELLKNKRGTIVALNNLTILEGEMKETEISQNARLARKNEVNDLKADLQTKVLTPGMVHLKVNVVGEKGTRLKFCFEKLISGKIVARSGWLQEPEYLDGECQADKQYQYQVKVKDLHGNVRLLGNPLKVKTALEGFKIWSDDFQNQHDYIGQGCETTSWNALSGKITDGFVVKAENGKLRIQSKGTQVQRQETSAPFLYREVTGDFVVQVKVCDVKGLAHQRGCAYNEAGIMILKESERGIDEVHLSLFPMYPDKGNMWTSLSGYGRPQVGNATGWEPDPYLQIEKRGEYIYLRTGKDGKHWKDMPSTPLHRPDLNGTVRVGLFQTTYTDEEGYGDFEEYRLFLPSVVPGVFLR